MPIVKILVVTDEDGGFQRSNSASHKFHLGEFIKVLTDTAWSGFTVEVTRAHRHDDPSPGTPQASHPIGADLYGFRFSAASLAGFDMALFFSIADKSEDPVASDASRREEAAAVAEFMESGRGFFAAGDHEDLGASICQHIPRVRSMRRWAKSTTGPHGGPVAPSGTESDRHDTLRSGVDTGTNGGTSFPFQFNDQSDDLPQPISPRAYTLWRSRWFATTIVHPLLCSPLGRVSVLPDHMHEGWCEVPGDLTRIEDLPGRAGKQEYPLDSDGNVVEPEVIADATVLAHETLNQEFGGSFAISPATPGPYSFGVIGAYDGHRAGVGRIVVDATWHHFVNINVTDHIQGFASDSPTKGYTTGPAKCHAVRAHQVVLPQHCLLVHFRRARALLRAARARRRGHEASKLGRSEDHALSQRPGRGRRVQAVHALRAAGGGLLQLDARTLHEAQAARSPALSHQAALSVGDLAADRSGDRSLESACPPAGQARTQPGWRQAVLPDANILRQTLLGTMALAVTEIVPRYGDVDEKQFAAVQRRVTELLPKHLEIAAGEIDSGARDARVLASQLREMAQGMRPGAAWRTESGRTRMSETSPAWI